MEVLTASKKQEIIFGIYNHSEKNAKAVIEDGKLISIKLLIKVPAGYYYSFLNDAEFSFLEQYPEYK